MISRRRFTAAAAATIATGPFIRCAGDSGQPMSGAVRGSRYTTSIDSTTGCSTSRRSVLERRC